MFAAGAMLVGSGARSNMAVCMTANVASGCESLLRTLFEGTVDADTVAAACSANVEWKDMSAKEAAVGPAAVLDLIAAKFPEGSKLAIDRCSDGQKSGGFVWHREAADRPGQIGLRGTLYAELDDAGKLCYVQEGCEPIVKPGEATEALLKAATANMEKPEKPPPTFTQETPTTASGIVRESELQPAPLLAPAEPVSTRVKATPRC